MSTWRRPSILDSFNYAFEGIIHVLRTQRNMRIHFATAIGVLASEGDSEGCCGGGTCAGVLVSGSRRLPRVRRANKTVDLTGAAHRAA